MPYELQVQALILSLWNMAVFYCVSYNFTAEADGANTRTHISSVFFWYERELATFPCAFSW